MKRTLTSHSLALLSAIAIPALLAPLPAAARSLIPDQPSVEIRLEALRALRASTGGTIPGNPFRTPPSAPLSPPAPPNQPPAYQPPVYQPPVYQPKPPVVAPPPVAALPYAPVPVAPPTPQVLKQSASKKPAKKPLGKSPVAAAEKPVRSTALPTPTKKAPATNDDVYRAGEVMQPPPPFAPVNASPRNAKAGKTAKPVPVVPEPQPSGMELSLDDVMKNTDGDAKNAPAAKAPSTPPAEKMQAVREKNLSKGTAGDKAATPSSVKDKALPEPDLGDLKFEPFTPLTDGHPGGKAHDQKGKGAGKTESDRSAPPPLADVKPDVSLKNDQGTLELPPLPDKGPQPLQEKKQAAKKETSADHVKKPSLKEPVSVKNEPEALTPPLAPDAAVPSLADLDALPDDASKDAPLTLAPAKGAFHADSAGKMTEKEKKPEKKTDKDLKNLAALPDPAKGEAEALPGISEPLPLMGNKQRTGKMPAADTPAAGENKPAEEISSKAPALAAPQPATPGPATPKKEGFLPNLKSSFASFLGGKKQEEAPKPSSSHSVAPAISPASPDVSVTPEAKDGKGADGLPALPNFNSSGAPKAVPTLGATTALPPLPAFAAGGAAKPDEKITTDEPLPPLPFGNKKTSAAKNAPAADLPEEKQLASLDAAKSTGIGAPGIGAPGIGAPGIGAPGIGAPGIGAPGIGAPDIGMPPLKDPSLGEASQGASLSVLFSQSETEVPLAFQQPLINMSKELVGNDTKIKVIAYASGSADQKSIARRISLARALAVRAFLIDLGVDNVRISVQALGNDVQKGPSERADVILLPKG